jgi:hypothetical protein
MDGVGQMQLPGMESVHIDSIIVAPVAVVADDGQFAGMCMEPNLMCAPGLWHG